MSATGQYSVFIGNRGWTYGFTSMKAARTFVAAHEGYRYDIHKGAKLVESGKVHPPTPGTGGRVWLVRNPSRRPMRGAFKGAERKRKTKTASYVGGKRSKSRGTHKYFRAGFAAASNPSDPTAAYAYGAKLARQGGWNSKQEAWDWAKGQLRAAGQSATAADKKEFMLAWAANRERPAGRNPLPVGKFVTVRAKRLPGGRIELRGTR